jgi:hypothetical protein
LFLSAGSLAWPSDQLGALDPAFEKVPFDRWLNEREPGPFHWSAGVSRAELSFHQRLAARVEIKLDGKDLDSRRSDGSLVFLIQVTDRGGTRYRNHGGLELNKLDENIKAADVELSQRAFFVPGDYRLAVAILDTATGEHSTKQANFRVPPPSHGSLPGAWQDLPPVEFVFDEEPPDGWYLPGASGRLQWAAFVHAPARINVILNVAPPQVAPGSHRSQSGDLAALLPTLKAISQTGSSSISEHVELLDLARRRATFHQADVHDLDWPRLKASLSEASTASIDLHSLSERHHDAQFFVSEVRRLLRASQEPCVLVVLSSPVAFDSGEDLQPISLEALPACRVVYIRYRAAVHTNRPVERQMGGRGRGSRSGGQMSGPMGGDRRRQDVVDQLEATLKPLNPKVFDVETPEEIARAIAEIAKALPGLARQSSP